MKITETKIQVRDLAAGYKDSGDAGVVAYGGKLDVRPPYQREFIYKDAAKQAVIDTIESGFPLNIMYWAVREDGTYEIIDGQQRTISICQYVNGDYSHDMMYFHNLQPDQQEVILNYELTVYLCEGTPSEKLDWFQVINIAGEILTEQEIRNAVYAGPWLADAKRYFSKNSCPAYGLASKLMNGTPIRQDYLETVIDWISKGNIEIYMAKHQHDSDASDLWIYFQQVIAWVNAKFRPYNKFMKGVDWGRLYNEHSGDVLDPVAIDKRVKELMIDDDVNNKKGIYEYILTGEEKHLSIRAFTDAMKIAAYTRQAGECPHCVAEGAAKTTWMLEEMEADHITPWHLGGPTTTANCQMLCKHHNRKKSGK